jgi:hypothetical protein
MIATLDALVAGELLAVRTTRAAGRIVAALAGFLLLTGWAPTLLVGAQHAPHTLSEGSATIGITVALLVGVHQTAGDLQHGMTRTLALVTPSRARVHLAQLVTAALLGAVIGTLTAALGTLIQAVLGTLDLPAADVVRVAAGTLIASTLYAASGAAAGLLARGQALGTALVLLWTYLAEPFVARLSYTAYTLLPGGAREALLRHASAHHHIPSMPTGTLLLLAFTLLVAAIAIATTRRVDLT